MYTRGCLSGCRNVSARARAFGPYIFGEHQTTDMNVVTDVWRRKLNKLWTLCEPWKEKPTPHRFRHTFARILLQRPGVSIRDVAELLGNTEQMYGSITQLGYQNGKND
jgi:site-specific recombinase XerD